MLSAHSEEAHRHIVAFLPNIPKPGMIATLNVSGEYFRFKKITNSEYEIVSGAPVPKSSSTCCGGSPIVPARVVIINRPDRKDRRSILENHLREIGWPFIAPEWHSATPGSKYKIPDYWKSPANVYACNQSHLQILKESMERGDENVWVMEDDCIYLPDFLRRVSFLFRHTPKDWGMIYFGGKFSDYSKSGKQGSVNINDWYPHEIASTKRLRVHGDLFEVAGMNNTESYMVSKSALPYIVKQLEKTALHVDVVLNLHQHHVKTYTMRPPIAQQRAFKSDNFGYNHGEHSGRLTTSHENGAVFLSTGQKRRKMLFNAVASFSRNNPRNAVKILSDMEAHGYDVSVVEDLTGFASRSLKTSILQNPPLKSGVVLDDDTIVFSQLPPVDEILQDCDIALAPDSFSTIQSICTSQAPAALRWLTREEAEYTLCNFLVTPEDIHYNTGVIFYKDSPVVRHFSKVWKEEWERFRRIDQIAFWRAAKITGIRIRTLPVELHWVAASEGNPPPGAKIAHLTGRKHKYEQTLVEWGLPVIPLPKIPTPGCCGGGRPAVAGKAPLGESFRIQVDMSKEGPRMWKRLHEYALQETDLDVFKAWIETDWIPSIPCPTCHANFHRWFSRNRPTVDIFEWSVKAHNFVNEKRGVEKITIAEARYIWSRNL